MTTTTISKASSSSFSADAVSYTTNFLGPPKVPKESVSPIFRNFKRLRARIARVCPEMLVANGCYIMVTLIHGAYCSRLVSQKLNDCNDVLLIFTRPGSVWILALPEDRKTLEGVHWGRVEEIESVTMESLKGEQMGNGHFNGRWILRGGSDVKKSVVIDYTLLNDYR